MSSVASKTLYRIGGGDRNNGFRADGESAAHLSVQDESMARVAGVILAGTQPWGACALERVVPRALAPIANQPLLSHVLGWLAHAGIRSANICGNTYTDLVRRRLTRGISGACSPNWLSIDYYEDLAPRGPAGCVRDAGLGSGCDTVVAVEGSLIPQVSLSELVEFHRRSEAALTVVVSKAPRDNGGAEGGLWPMGIYVLSRSALTEISPHGYQDIKEALIPHLYKRQLSVMPFLTTCVTPRVTSVDSYLAVNGWMLRTLGHRQEEWHRYCGEGYRTNGQAGAHSTAAIDSTARLIGPILIGEGATVGAGVTVVGPTSIGSHCHIGEGAVVCRSSLWDECSVGSGAVLDRCIVTSRAGVRADTANRYVVFAEQQSRLAYLSRWFRKRNGG